MRTRLLLSALVTLLVATGCRDLSFDDSTHNTGPVIEFRSPSLSGDALPLRAQVDLRVQDPDGVSTVSLSCGDASNVAIELVKWVGAPYSGEVDLARCFGPTVVADPAPLKLTVTATDSAGAITNASLDVVVSRALPSLSAEVPPRTAPGAEVRIPLFSNEPLAALPSVTVGGAPAQVTGDLEQGTFEARFVAPQFDPFTGATVAELETTERVLDLEFAALGNNGNTVHFSRSMVVSRVLWERPIPGRVYDPVIGNAVPPAPTAVDERPFGVDDGLWVPLASENNFGEPTWMPGHFAAADGTFTAPNSKGGLAARGFGLDGTALIESDGTVTAVRPDGAELGTLNFLSGALLKFDDRTCVIQDPRSITNNCLPALSIQCVDQNGVTPLTPPGIPTSANVVNPRWVVRSGPVSLSFASDALFDECQTAADPDSLLYVTDQSASYDTLKGALATVSRVLPFGSSGSFLLSGNDAVGGRAAFRVAPGAGVTAFNSATGVLPDKIIAALDSGELILVTASGTQTALQRIGTDGKPNLTTNLPGLFEYAVDPALPALPINVVRTASGGYVYLARTHSFGRAVVALDAQLEPQWVYHYPRGTSRASLVADTAGSALYLVDYDNAFAVALVRPD